MSTKLISTARIRGNAFFQNIFLHIKKIFEKKIVIKKMKKVLIKQFEKSFGKKIRKMKLKKKIEKL